MTRSAYEVQRDFALSCGLRSEIIWDALSPDQADVLKQKIAGIIHENEGKRKKTLARQRLRVFENVWQQRKYTNRMLLSAIIYVLVTDERDPERALHSTRFSCHPVIRTRKCVREESVDSGECCMIFIDEHGRVYGNWRQYVYHNTLPKGTMIAPSHGVYRLTEEPDSSVFLMLHATPASRVNRQLLHAGDALATFGGLAASVPVAAALAALPVAPTMLLAATVVGVSTAAYSTVRSVTCLYDRRQHGQSLSLLDNGARNNWLGVAGGVVGLGATGATTALSVAHSEVNAAAQLAVKGINVSSIVISGTGVANGVYDLYLKISDDQPLSSIDVLQVAASLVIFTHAINNLRLANKVTNGYSLRQAVSNQTRKVFGQIAEESAQLHRDSAGQKFDIVRTLNDIPFKAALLGMHEVYRHLAQGSTPLAAVHATLLPNLITSDADGQTHLSVDLLSKWLGAKFVRHISNLGSLSDVLAALATYFGAESTQLLMQLARSFLEQHVDAIDRALNTFLSTEMVLYRILMQCINDYENFTYEFLEGCRDEIVANVSKHFQSMQPLDAQSSRRHECPDCHGVFYLSDI